jgi:hypothetical protein
MIEFDSWSKVDWKILGLPLAKDNKIASKLANLPPPTAHKNVRTR